MSLNYATAVETWKIDPLAGLISPAAWLRQVSVWLFGYDPFEDRSKQHSGDWDAYVHCAAAGRIIGDALFAVGRNLVTAAGDAPEVWRGNTAEAGARRGPMRVADRAVVQGGHAAVQHVRHNASRTT
ncbi:hypothetical protein ACN265_19215 [Micromonospora sp. WMMD730]|uniref:hypothetical protein n=1 Tax=Micromonospora sp. WMMD730 TaxID=3404128 RepID=UPI003B92E985